MKRITVLDLFIVTFTYFEKISIHEMIFKHKIQCLVSVLEKSETPIPYFSDISSPKIFLRNFATWKFMKPAKFTVQKFAIK